MDYEDGRLQTQPGCTAEETLEVTIILTYILMADIVYRHAYVQLLLKSNSKLACDCTLLFYKKAPPQVKFLYGKVLSVKPCSLLGKWYMISLKSRRKFQRGVVYFLHKTRSSLYDLFVQ